MHRAMALTRGAALPSASHSQRCHGNALCPSVVPAALARRRRQLFVGQSLVPSHRGNAEKRTSSCVHALLQSRLMQQPNPASAIRCNTTQPCFRQTASVSCSFSY
ncbi:hypothetical protein M441DRAFT_382320 [Trichoderma asperellum CBS 433.97]|uniref:Uncharacterized protein n=1 Tax=Trichoderma asperellum (strain ATCC 204424 / CBS 433.97 / NBRC 101777) TaxID=1042311 RepID=A0A2T3ZBB0_TRIA4|nr:hypothetical protein M441DRAFT_382320 [Trichoderma asperellum CBS 433.97]PTB42072.1 hypothetical protein M441DRAFT_382320 [Trichoderma asperellum CBS 433.97]